MTISTKKPLYAEVHNVPDDYEFTDEELNRIIAGDMFTPRQDAIMAREIQKLRAAMLHGAEPVKQTYKLPPLSSSEVNEAAWRLHNMLTECIPLNGHQFNNLKGCFYEALKVAMRNSPVIPDGLSTVCAEAYQVVGVMADALGVFGDAAVQKVLDNLSQQKLVHRDVLPFSLPVTPDGWVMVPKQVTPEISNAINVVGQRCTCGNCSQRLWDLLLDATQQGVNRG